MIMARQDTVRISFLILWIACGAIPALAQESPVEPELPVESVPLKNGAEGEAQELFAAIEEKSEEFKGLQELVTGASSEDVKALKKRAAEIVDVVLSDLERLAVNVVERERDGLDASIDRERVSEMMRRLAGFLQDVVVRDEAELSELRKARDDATPEELVDLNRKIATASTRFDRTLEVMLDEVFAMEGFGLACDEERAFLVEHLSRRAELVAGRILVGAEEIERLKKRLAAVSGNVDVATELDLAMQRFDGYVERLRKTVGLMNGLGMNTSEYRQLLFEVTGEITTGLFSREVLASLMKVWVNNAKDGLVKHGPSVVFKIVLFVLILVVFRILARIARKVVRKAISASNLRISTLLERTALSVTGAAVMVFGVLVALSQLGFQVGPLLAGLGVVGFIVGFALQDTLSNFASGVMILLYRPYDVGDLIETAGAMGKVENMTLVSTTILTVDHQTLVIPNSRIWGDVIKNVTAQRERRIDMVFGIGYADDIPHAERVLTEILESHELVLDDPEPIVKLHNLGDSSVDFVVRPWVKTDDYWDVYWDITREVKIRFDSEGISIPFPQRDVHVFNEGQNEPG